MMKNGDYAAACPRLAESARLEPTVGALLVGGGLAVWWLSAGSGTARTGVLVTPAGVAGSF